MSEGWVNVYAYGQRWPLTARANWPSRSRACLASHNFGDIKPLYRIHIIPKR